MVYRTPVRVFVKLFLSIILFLAGCSRISGIPADQKTVTLKIFAAASLTEALSQIGKNFEDQHTGVSLAFNFAGSQQLAQQIDQGAPADVFASADLEKMQSAVQSGRVNEQQVRVFAHNRLVAIVPSSDPADIQILQDLAKPGLKIILAAKEVPAGQYALTFLDKASQDPAFGAGYKAQVLKNVVSYEENVRAVLSKVALGEADAGIVYSTDASGANQEGIHSISIPDALNVVADYAIAPLSDSQQFSLASALVDYILSPAGQKILDQYGFLPAH